MKNNFKEFLWERSRPIILPEDRLTEYLFEREGDKEQLDYAKEIYVKVARNIETIPLIKIEGHPAYNLKQAIGKDLLVIFYGEETGCLFYNRNGDGIGVPTIRIGRDLYEFKDNDFYRFWLKNRHVIIHELIHLNDHERIGKVITSDKNEKKQYYNNPLEFNAFYMEVIDHFYEEVIFGNKKLPSIKDFIKSAWDYVYQMQPELEDNISDKMKNKWNKRFYQLYDELRKELGVVNEK